MPTVYIARDGEELGAWSLEDAQARLRSGEIALTDYFWHEGMSDWKQVSQSKFAQAAVRRDSAQRDATLNTMPPYFEPLDTKSTIESFGKTILAIVTAAVILWLGYHFSIELPAQRRAQGREFRAHMDSVHKQQQLFDRWIANGPDSVEARAEYYREKEREEAREDRRKP